ncbi:DUF192 domain-containing protein [Chitinimonas koreensis]|uniref:DUF192 domain-containing protein n=2 Tax=Chitinimonas koreensis TaxID=356302 RepID=UPI0004249985|nr:DUF192 domain-containing protein [Chitinimonas koreensis]
MSTATTAAAAAAGFGLPRATLALPAGPLELHLAHRLLPRLRGLLGRRPLRRGEGLSLAPCNSVHTFGMRYPIDVLFLDRADRIVAIRPALPPWRLALCGSAWRVVELPAGDAARLGLERGQQLPPVTETP